MQSSTAPDTAPILTVRNLSKEYPIRSGVLRRTIGHLPVLRDVSFEVRANETHALVMPAKSGKTVLARILLQLERPSSGTVWFKGENITKLRRAKQQKLRQQMQMIFEDPYMAINPRLKIEDIVGEPLMIHKRVSSQNKRHRVKELLVQVGLNPYVARRFPYELSGGQRQRVVLARALATEPALLIFDDLFAELNELLVEPFLTLLNQLKAQHQLSYLFLTSHLSEVKSFADRVSIFYLGEQVELAQGHTLFKTPAHPYTHYLLSQIPLADYDKESERQPIKIKAEADDTLRIPPACAFHPRCPYASDICHSEKPPLRAFEGADSPHLVSCHHAERIVE